MTSNVGINTGSVDENCNYSTCILRGGYVFLYAAMYS